ncbi:PEP/pyruvate-binding domain-containing protein [Serratia plymuthica]|uniref:PEP/pyruvate-binding domain-containing protein n=1 Tax=Serratia plymuthica TaxID=82996 RepID=UPI0018D74A12|nr:PEP/pyruvate-binding domain-containing protein [Serratia plymuthica]QPS54352.1 phosphoenolpyruvate synthase [Serratia plymuthica]CAI1773873.1 Phosphoenolpyruvate synthase [Serratia plymuthica]
MSRSLIVELSGDPMLKHHHLGGKGYSLNHLIKAGLPVPPAFCITAQAYQQFIEATVPGQILTKGARGEVRDIILGANVPTSLQQAINDAYQQLGDDASIAVRSSALEEDGQHQSFAGQYDTYLHVKGAEDVLRKVQSCWASLWAERTAHYSQTHASESEIAVVLQVMVDADAAGVMFTQDPLTGNADQVVIDSCWGLGEGVVSGQVTTDSFTLDKASADLCDRQIRHKSHYCQRDAQGQVTLLSTPEAKRDIPSLTPEQLRQLVTLARQAQLIYRTELDIEWAVKDNQVWLLQARPVTTQAKPAQVIYANPWEKDQAIKDRAFFSRMDTGEIVTGLMTPLGLSFCRFYQKHIHGPAIKTMGLADISDWQIYMGYIQGYVYLNISGSAYMLRQCPPTRDEMKFTTRYATADIDFSHYENPYGKGVQGWSYVKSGWYWLKQQVHNLRSAANTVEQMIALRQQETRRFLALDLTALSLVELEQELQRVDRFFLDSCAAYMPFFLQSFALYDALAQTCERYLKGRGQGLQNRIKASMNNLRTIEVTLGIIKMVDKVNRQPALKALFEQHSANELVNILPEDEISRAFWQGDFKDFLFEFGTRGRQEFELSIPRWNDDPSYLLQVMKMYLQHPVDLQKKLRETERLRHQDSEALFKEMTWVGRFKLKTLTRLYAVMAERREATRPTFITETWFYRCIMLEVLRRLETQGVVKMSDLPYVDFEQFRAYMAGKIPAQQAFAQTLLDQNRHQHLLNLHAEEPPLAIIGSYTPKMKTPAADNTAGVFTGLAASPGKVVGKARVITDLPTQAGELQPNEILVARFTDASWTPLFALATGIVTDIGSTLSHSCIVAREFGIPAVVNLKVATQLIASGDTLILDGDSGTVIIQRGEEPDADG